MDNYTFEDYIKDFELDYLGFDGNHSLETGDRLKDSRSLERVMKETEDFVKDADTKV